MSKVSFPKTKRRACLVLTCPRLAGCIPAGSQTSRPSVHFAESMNQCQKLVQALFAVKKNSPTAAELMMNVN